MYNKKFDNPYYHLSEPDSSLGFLSKVEQKKSSFCHYSLC